MHFREIGGNKSMQKPLLLQQNVAIIRKKLVLSVLVKYTICYDYN